MSETPAPVLDETAPQAYPRPVDTDAQPGKDAQAVSTAPALRRRRPPSIQEQARRHAWGMMWGAANSRAAAAMREETQE